MTSFTPLRPVSYPDAGIEPFLKWPGGKRWAVKQLVALLSPHLTRRYFEPFLGGGAVYFALCPKRAVLTDINADLINVYLQVRDNPTHLVKRLKRLTVSENAYYRIRSNMPRGALARATRLLYLNRTAFSGIYRLNRAGQFNVPYGGGGRTPEILWGKGLIVAASGALKNATLKAMDFEKAIRVTGAGDVVYCDPTYTVAHESNGFVRYNERNFSWADQERLAASALAACKRGAFVVVSNAAHPSIGRLYEPFVPNILARTSCVSPIASHRRTVHEYVFVLDPAR